MSDAEWAAVRDLLPVPGWLAAGPRTPAAPQGVKVLTQGTYLLAPHGPQGACAAAWLSRPAHGAAP
ncbi:hypothetical protein [Streptomyces sp. NPDC003077]|uniref:hypothetical protein n=1 Tax=Streptomyces sp. NPDC003077 TaxID=3154443 RepID=UPI0033B328EC